MGDLPSADRCSLGDRADRTELADRQAGTDARWSDAGRSTSWGVLWMVFTMTVAWVPALLADRLGPAPTEAALWESSEAPASGQSPIPFPVLTPLPLAESAAVAGTSIRREHRSEAGDIPPGSGSPSSLAPPADPRVTNPQRPEPTETGPEFVGSALEDLPGSVLLGGPLGLESIHEKAMVPAARSEQAMRARSTDPLLALPPLWRRPMAVLLGGRSNLMTAEVVRLPATHLRRPEEIPLAVQGGGQAETTIEPSSPLSRRLIERWAAQQPTLPEGKVRPVLVVLEPLVAEPLTSASDPRAAAISPVETASSEPADSPHKETIAP